MRIKVLFVMAALEIATSKIVAAVKKISPSANTKVIPGHGPTVDRAAVIAHRDMILAIRDRVAPMVKQGKTAQEIVAAKPTADYDSKIEQVGTTADRFVNQLYAELGGK